MYTVTDRLYQSRLKSTTTRLLSLNFSYTAVNVMSIKMRKTIMFSSEKHNIHCGEGDVIVDLFLYIFLLVGRGW